MLLCPIVRRDPFYGLRYVWFDASKGEASSLTAWHPIVWLQRQDLHLRSPGYEPDELLLLHSALIWGDICIGAPEHRRPQKGSLVPNLEGWWNLTTNLTFLFTLSTVLAQSTSSYVIQSRICHPIIL